MQQLRLTSVITICPHTTLPKIPHWKGYGMTHIFSVSFSFKNVLNHKQDSFSYQNTKKELYKNPAGFQHAGITGSGRRVGCNPARDSLDEPSPVLANQAPHAHLATGTLGAVGRPLALPVLIGRRSSSKAGKLSLSAQIRASAPLPSIGQ